MNQPSRLRSTIPAAQAAAKPPPTLATLLGIAASFTATKSSLARNPRQAQKLRYTVNPDGTIVVKVNDARLNCPGDAA